MMLVIKLIVFIIGCIEGFFGGMEGAVVGGTYDPGLSDIQINALKEKSKLFKIADDYTMMFMFFYNPFIIFICICIFCLIWSFYPEFLNIAKSQYNNFLVILMIYMCASYINYFIGMSYCNNLQRKYKIYSIK